MSLQVTGIEVRLPDRARRAALAYSAKKPMAEVSLSLDNGRTREIVVPVRVGRVLRDECIPLPQGEDEAFDAIHALEGRVCLAMLTEMLSRRDHGTEEAKRKLRLYGFRDIEIDTAVARATELRFLNDNRFAGYFIEERKRRGWGMRKVEAELKRRGMDPTSIDGWPDAFFSPEDDIERARQILARKIIPSQRGYEKLMRHLVGKGFSFDVASRAVRERIDGSDLDET